MPVSCPDVLVEPRQARWAAFVEGLRAALPLLAGILPFAVICGAATVDVGVPVPEALAFSVVVFAGASQLAAVDLIGQGAPWAVVVATALVVNARMLMYSAAIGPHFRGLSVGKRGVLSYFLTDGAFALSMARYLSDGRHRAWYFLGAGFALWAVWQAGYAAGVLAGTAVPASWGLDFAVPLTFMGMLFAFLKDRPTVWTAVVAAAVAVIAVAVPYSLGLLLAVAAGVGVGMLREGRS